MSTFMRRVRRRIKRTLMSPRERRERERHALVGPPHLWKMKREFQITFLTERGLEPQHHLFDLGCGTLRGGIPLIEYLDAGKYTGVDVRPETLHEANSELTQAGLEHKRPTLSTLQDLDRDQLAGIFEFCWAFSVLIHLDDEALDEALDLIERIMAPEGVFFANVNVGDDAWGTWQGFPIVYRTIDQWHAIAARHGLSASALGTLAELGHHSGSARGDAQVMLKFAHADSSQ